MSSWGCQSGYWNTGNCATAKKAKFNQSLTVRVYEVGPGGEPGDQIGTVTHTFGMPYRPAANYAKCSGADQGKWYNKGDATCYNGMAFTVRVKLGGLDLPDTAIISVSFDTTHFGYDPVGEDTACFTGNGGCPYDALNVGTSDSSPSAGYQPLPDDAYYNSAYGPNYCDGGASGSGTFRLDSGCWTGYQPGFQVQAA